MANLTDDNDLGPQVIEGTEPPIIYDAVLVTPSDDGADNAAKTSDEPIIAPPPPQTEKAEESTSSEQFVTPSAEATNAEPKTAQPVYEQTADDLDAQLAAIINDTEPVVAAPPPVTENVAAAPSADPQAEVQEQIGQFLDDQLNRLLDEDDIEQRAQAVAQEQIGKHLDDELNRILADQMLEDKEKAAEERAQSMVEQARLIMEQAQAAQDAIQKAQSENNTAAPQSDAATEAAKTMMEQARLMMEQAQAAQIAAAQQVQAAAAQATAKPEPQSDATTEAAKAMMEQARLMMEHAQAAAQQAQAAAAEARAAKPDTQSDAATETAREMMRRAQLMMQQAQEANLRAGAATAKPDETNTRSAAEVDRLRNEIDGLRDLLNKLTFSMAQTQNGVNAGIPAQQMVPPYYGDTSDRFRKLQDELELMRRDLAEKDLKDRERELERKQKEAETVKDIRPEMIQMSDPDMLPGAAQQQGSQSPFGQEYIALADGVFYSTKDKQIYVMTPASKAVSTAPATTRKAVAAPKPAAKPAVKRKPKIKAAKRHAPGSASGSRRHGAPRHRPTRPSR